MRESKSSTIWRFRREADAAKERAKQLVRDSLLAPDAGRRSRMSLDASSLLMEAAALRKHADELEKNWALDPE
jgi:hypothetical protein